MSTITLPNIRVSSDLTVGVVLKDGGVAIDWSTLSNIKAYLYADAQRAMAGRCSVSVDEEDSTRLVCSYRANKPQYIGVNRIVITCTYRGETKTFDKPALNFVRWTDDQAGHQITIDDPDVDVEIEVEDVSSSILEQAIAAALQAAADAEHAAHLIPNQVLLDCEQATAGANAAAEAANAAGITSVNVSVEDNEPGTPSADVSLVNKVLSVIFHYLKGETGDAAGFGAITASFVEDGGDPSVLVTTSGPDTAKNIAFTLKNFKGDKGDKGDQGNSGYQGAAGELEVVNNLTDGGSTAALSAEMGKTLEGEVSQLELKVNGKTSTYTDQTETSTASSYWVDNNGVIGYSASGMGLHRVDAILVTEGETIELTTTLGSTTAKAAYFCDDSDNIIQTIAKDGANTEWTGTVPNGATRVYVNYLSTFILSAIIHSEFYLMAKDYDGKIDAEKYRLDGVALDSDTALAQTGGTRELSIETSSLGNNIISHPIRIPKGTNIKVKTVGLASVASGDATMYYFSNGVRTYWAAINDTEKNLVGLNLDIDGLGFYIAAHEITTPGTFTVEVTTDGILQGEIDTINSEISDINTDLSLINDKIGETTHNDEVFSEGYKIWIISGGKVTASASSFENQRNVTPLAVESGEKINITQSIYGTALKAIFADDSDNAISSVEYTGSVTNYIVPEGAKRLYINRKIGAEYSCSIQSVYSTRLDALVSGDAEKKISLPIYAPSPQKAADGQNGTLDAENSTSDQVFAKIDEAIAKYTNYAVGEVLGKDATNTYDVKRYILCRANLYAWKANVPFYAWKTGANTRFIKSCSPRVGDSIYDSTLTSVIATVASFDCTDGVMTDSANATYSREKTSDIPADIIYTIRQSFTFDFDIYTKSGSVITRLTKTTWDSDTNTITYNGKAYARSRVYDWNTNCKATIVLWGNEHAAQSDPHECAIVLYRLMRDLCQSGPSGNKFLSFLKNYCKVIILPIVNPYGFTRYATLKNPSGRLNGNGVNLNRNYPTIGWTADSGANYGGAYGGSEIEVQYVINTCIEFVANVGIDIHCLGYTEQANEGTCAYGGNFSIYDAEKQDVLAVANSMLSDYDITLVNYGTAYADGVGQGKNWLLANDIEGGLVEMNAGAYALQYNGNQHTAFIMEADYTYLLRMLNVWNNRFSDTMNLGNYTEG